MVVAAKVKWEQEGRMRKIRRERSPLYPKILFAFTEHPITVWAGVILLRLYFEWIGIAQGIRGVLGGFCEAVEQPDPSSRCDAELVLRIGVRSGTF